MNILTNLRIPTLLGLTLIIAGLSGGVYLILHQQTLQTKASPSLNPQNIEVTNIEENSFSVSWQTLQNSLGFLMVNINGSDQTFLDDQDLTSPKARLFHHVTVKNLTPETSYSYVIVSGKNKTSPAKITTASPAGAGSPNPHPPVIGQARLPDGLAFLEVRGAIKQSTPIKEYGNFVIPLASMRKADLTDIFLPDDQTVAKITVVGENAQSSITFYLKDAQKPLPALSLNQNLDLTTKVSTTEAKISKFDINNDGLINSSDYSIVLKNFGKNPKEKRADLNADGIVDQKDLKLMQEQINQ